MISSRCTRCGGSGRAPLPPHLATALALLAAWEPATVATLAEHSRRSERTLRDQLAQLLRAKLVQVGGAPQRWARTKEGRAAAPDDQRR